VVDVGNNAKVADVFHGYKRDANVRKNKA